MAGNTSIVCVCHAAVALLGAPEQRFLSAADACPRINGTMIPSLEWYGLHWLLI